MFHKWAAEKIHKKVEEWWTNDQENAYQKIKTLAVKPPILGCNDPNKEE